MKTGPQSKNCPKCGEEFKLRAGKHCPFCGAKLQLLIDSPRTHTTHFYRQMFDGSWMYINNLDDPPISQFTVPE